MIARLDWRPVTLAFMWMLPSVASARTWHILVDGSGDAPTVQAGIDSSVTGDTVLVGPGTYLENISFLGKDVVVKSEQGPNVTILDGGGKEESVVLLANDEGSGAILEGFKITNGRGHRISVDQTDGGGIFMRARCPVIRNNHFINNSGSPYGGGIYIGSASSISIPVSPILENNLFERNSARLGGGIADLWGNAVIRNNVFRHNDALYDGAGIFISMWNGSPTVINNEFWENLAQDHGGGVYASDGGIHRSMVLSYNLFVRNIAQGSGSGDSGSGGAIWFKFGGVLSNNTLVDNLGNGESLCSAGGVLLDSTPPDLEIKDNIIAFNSSCGLACEPGVETLPGRNLFWQNADGNFGTSLRPCDPAWEAMALVADPFFCNPSTDDYTLAQNSPAVGMGAFPNSACGPVYTKPSTWGRLKALYRP